MVNISEKISSLRKAHNLTQEALGEAVGVSPQAVSKWEKGDSLPDISAIPDICRIFGISADALLGNEGNMTSEMYVDKALEICNGGIDEKMRLLHKIIADVGSIKNDTTKDYLVSALWDAQAFSQADSRGFGMFFSDIKYIKNMMAVDLTASKLLKLMSDPAAIKIFSLICINGGLNESEISKLTGFTEQEIAERLFTMMKFSLIESSMHKINGINEMAFSMASHGILLLGIMASIYLFEPESRTGKLGIMGQRNSNPDKQRKYME